MKKLTQAALIKEMARLDRINLIYKEDGNSKFIDDEINRLRGLVIDLQNEKEKKDFDRRRRRQKT